jgi:hypothetical protein
MPEWLWALVIGAVVLGLVATVWRMHENHDRERNNAVWDQLGRSSEEGMRKIVHDSANRLSEVVPVSRELERRVDRIERVLNGRLRSVDER